ncbi:hypothetical protein C8Q79DRAFT_1040192 [Trametes meyenii]|nr:hypothetical protein C8Q79DRAFT_1040192 [Trametes meyenii]
MAGMAQQTRPEPMNASPYHSKVRVSLKFADTQFAAGGTVTGKIELECKAEKGLGIGVIMVELYAIEELTSRDHSATSTFLHSRRLFQGPGLPPSNSVHPYPSPGDPPLPSNYYHARRGITTFLFQFPLPISSPSSIDFGSGLARLRYEVRASVGVAWKGEKKLVTDKKPIDVVERLEEHLSRTESDGVIVGENGKIWMQGRVLGGFMVAGEPACIELMVKNHSTKKNSGLSVTLTRELYLPNIPPGQKQPLQLSDTVTSVSFRGPEYIITPGAEGVANLVVDVPKNARGVKGGRRIGDEGKSTECLFEVRCIIGVKLSMGIGSKDLRLDLPVTILHPSIAPETFPYDIYAIPPAPPAIPMYDPASGMLYQPPMSPAPYFDRTTSPYTYPIPPMSPPIGPYIDHGQVWLPPPSLSPIPYNAYTPAPYYGHTAPQPSIVPFAPPPRPSSAEPTPSQPLYNLPPGLPPVVAPPPLFPMPTGATQSSVREEGKGERASRISHHLRMSSRHRSVSPPAHRYQVQDAIPMPVPVTLAAIPPASTAPYDAAQQSGTLSPSSSPDTRRGGTALSLSPLLTGAAVVAPRPMLSPKRSFTSDPFDAVTQVENLERLAAQDDPNPTAEQSTGDIDKTLPKPPVPTDKENFAASCGRADTLFTPSSLGVDAEETLPTSMLAALTPPAIQRGLRPGHDAPGLDALEAKLLAEVGTRKPERARAPDVRSVMPLPPPIAIPRPADVDKPNDSAISSLTLPGLDVDVDEKTLRKGGASVRGGSERGGDTGVGGGEEYGATSTTRARDSKETTRARESRETARGRERGSKETKKSGSGGGRRDRGEKHGSKRSADPDAGEKDKEIHHLKKAAQGRIAAWLGSIDPDAPPPSGTPPPQVLSPPSRSPARAADRSPTRSPARSPARSLMMSPVRSPARSPAPSSKASPADLPPVAGPILQEQKTTYADASDLPAASKADTQAAPNPRSSGFVAIGTVRASSLRPPTQTNGVDPEQKGATPWDAYLLPKASPRLAVYPPRPLDPEVKYDVRSARGGRGGIVTSVAALWASATQAPAPAAPKASAPFVPAKPQPKPTRLADQWKVKTTLDTPKLKSSSPKSEPSRTPPVGDGRPKALRPTMKTASSSPAVTPPIVDTAATSVADLTARRARMIKSASVPAVVSSSLATPMISSTASLARPALTPAERHKLNLKPPPTISEGEQPSTPVSATTPAPAAKSPPAKTELAFGQARLRELIKRYQGQVNP